MPSNVAGVKTIPRDSQGTYSLPSGTLVSTGDTVLVSQHNPPMVDLEQSMTNSLDRNGRGGMRATLNMGNNRISNLSPGTSPNDAATVSQALGVPLGGVIDYWGTSAPEGFTFPYGQELSRTEYSELFDVIGTSAGSGNGSTTFNLPDYRGRIGAGRDNMGGSSAGRLSSELPSTTIGGTGGESEVSLTESQMPSHSHTVNDPGHRHSVMGGISNNFFGGGSPTIGNINTQTGNSTTGISINSSGSGNPHNNVQPTVICNKIMRIR